MIAKVVMLLALLILFGCIGYLLFTKERLGKAYVKYVVYSLPFIGIDLIPSVFSFSIFDLITIVFYVGLYHRSTMVLHMHNPYYLLWVAFLLVLIVGLSYAEEITRDTATAVVQLISLFIFIKILYQELMYDFSLKRELLLGIRFLLLFSFIFLFLQIIVGPSFTIAKSENINVAGGVAIRYPSFFQDPQKYAQFLAATSFMVLINYDGHGIVKNRVNLILVVLALGAIMLTGGRAGLGGWLVGFMMLALFANSMYRTQLIIMIASFGVVSFLYQDLLPIFKRADLYDSYIFRQLIWQDALQIHQQHPFFGIGIGNYANYVSMHHPDQFWIHNNEITFFDHPESGYLKILVEFGIVGFAIVALFLVYPIYSSILAYKGNSNLEFILYPAALISWLIGFYTVYSFGDVRIKLLIAIIFTMMVAATHQNKIQLQRKQQAHV